MATSTMTEPDGSERVSLSWECDFTVALRSCTSLGLELARWLDSPLRLLACWLALVKEKYFAVAFRRCQIFLSVGGFTVALRSCT